MFPPATKPAGLALEVSGSCLAWPELPVDESDIASCIVLPAASTLPSPGAQVSWPDTPIPMSPLTSTASTSPATVQADAQGGPAGALGGDVGSATATSHRGGQGGGQQQPPLAASMGYRHKPRTATSALRSPGSFRSLAPLAAGLHHHQPTPPLTPTAIHAALSTMDRLFTTDFVPWLRDPTNTPLVASWLGAAARDVYVVGEGVPVPASALAAAMTYIVGPWSPGNMDQDLYWARMAHLAAGAACARGASVAETALLVHQLTMGPDAEHYARLMTSPSSISSSAAPAVAAVGTLPPTLAPPSLLASMSPSHFQLPQALQPDAARPPSPLVLLLAHLIPLITCPTVRHALVDQVVAGWPFAKSHALVCAVDARVPRGTLDMAWKRARVRMWAATMVPAAGATTHSAAMAATAAAAGSRMRLVRRRGSEDDDQPDVCGAPAKRRRTAAEGVTLE